LIDEDMRLIEEFHRTANHAVTDLCKLFEVIEASADAGRTGGRLAEE